MKMFKNLSETFILNNGIEIPCVGYGTYKTPDGEMAAEGVRFALECGYRHVDTAEFYENESGVGEGIRRSALPRNEIFITSKVWNSQQGYERTLSAFDASMKRLKVDYIDLYLIHWPAPVAYKDSFPKYLLSTWKALEKIYKEGCVRAIGVCNCLSHHLKPILENCEIKPAVNQIEYHPGLIQKETEEFSKSHGMIIEAWAPLCRGRAFGLEPLLSIAKKYGKTEAQVLLRWCLQHGVLPLPKSVTPSRIAENASVFDFVLSVEDMVLLDKFDACARLGSHPDAIDF